MPERIDRINQAIRGVLSEAISDLSDPRIGFVTITHVAIARDYRHAKVHISVLGSDEELQATLAALRSSQGILQRAVARGVSIKNTPVLEFVPDETIDTAFRVGELLQQETGDDDA